MYIQVEILWRLKHKLMLILPSVHKMINQLLVCLVYMIYIICYIFVFICVLCTALLLLFLPTVPHDASHRGY